MRAIRTQFKAGLRGGCDIHVDASHDVRGKVPFDGRASEEENHVKAALRIGEQAYPMDAYTLVSGRLPDGSWAHVLVKKAGK